MKLSFRWYGKDDPISLEYISQIPGMRSIVSAVYDVKPGEVWPEESIRKMKEQVEANELLKVIYFQAVDALSMQQVASWEQSERVQGCIAVQAGEIRLIDNVKIK